MIDGTLLINDFIDNDLANSLFINLRDNSNWDRSMLSRLTTSFGTPYNYSGINYYTTPMPNHLNDLVNKINNTLNFIPNNCLINWYLHGNSKMGYHSDRTDILSPGTGVAIISLGSTRILRFRNKIDKSITFDFTLRNGSLFYMTADVQDLWTHSIPTNDDTDGRMSLTFRNLI
jgi:alkylated DNA repair dioxygenase AlkB